MNSANSARRSLKASNITVNINSMLNPWHWLSSGGLSEELCARALHAMTSPPDINMTTMLDTHLYFYHADQLSWRPALVNPGEK